MSHRPAHYAVYVNSGPVSVREWHTRAEMAMSIRRMLQLAGIPASAFKQADIRNRWARIAKHGSSVQHFVIEAGDIRIAFDGMTVGEYEAATADAA